MSESKPLEWWEQELLDAGKNATEYDGLKGYDGPVPEFREPNIENAIPFSSEDENNPNFIADAVKKMIVEWFNGRSDSNADNAVISTDDVYIVWQVKALQNWKALASTSVADGLYYEVTYNGDKKQAYLDIYFKYQNVVVNFN